MAVECGDLMLVASQSERCGNAFRSSDERGLIPPRMTLFATVLLHHAHRAFANFGGKTV
jgi:hypothetical protein